MFDVRKGSQREIIDQDEQTRLTSSNTLFVDTRRRRPKYFDGRFLTARDLTRDQTYFLTRQADLGRAMGAGVVNGLMVEEGDSATSLRIQPGLGVTPSGEIVSVQTLLRLDLADIPLAQQLNAALGLSLRPLDPARSRSGIFVLALRPVEFTANPIASYPTSITGPRSVEDGEIIEATAVTLIPFPDEGDASEWNRRRSRVAHQIFVERAMRGMPAGVLPLAMVAVDRTVVQWLDPFLVRRELAVWQGEVLGLGLGTKALRYAQVQQYETQLQGILRDRGIRGQRFAAADHFLALPPVGHLPLASIDLKEFSQVYFPPEVEVELSIIPNDEVPVLLDESLSLPPIDLTLGEGEQDSTSVLILIPVDRTKLDEWKAKLTTVRRPFKTAAPGLVAKRLPLELLQGLRLPRMIMSQLPTSSLKDSAWREAVQSAADVGSGLLWYVRRRNLSLSLETAGITVSFSEVIRPEADLRDLRVRTPQVSDGATTPSTDVGTDATPARPDRATAPRKSRRRSASR
ncbi:MAG: hypothetical protein OEY86_02370 [Nitrospira sp.]|nr:hypothetical protein [Nitrospira sp.]